MGNVVYAVIEELRSARKAHRDMASLHEAHSVILEELEEFWDEVKVKKPDMEKVRHELLQVAAMAIRAIEDVVDKPASVGDAYLFGGDYTLSGVFRCPRQNWSEQCGLCRLTVRDTPPHHPYNYYGPNFKPATGTHDECIGCGAEIEFSGRFWFDIGPAKFARCAECPFPYCTHWCVKADQQRVAGG